MRPEFKAELERLVKREVDVMVRGEMDRMREELGRVKDQLRHVENERDQLRNELARERGEENASGRAHGSEKARNGISKEVSKGLNGERRGPRVAAKGGPGLYHKQDRSPEIKDELSPRLRSQEYSGKEPLWKSFSGNQGLAEIPNLRSKSWHNSISATQYSDDESPEPQSSPIKVSPIKALPTKASPIKASPKKFKDSVLDKLPTQYTDSSSPIKRLIPSSQIEIVENSEEEYLIEYNEHREEEYRENEYKGKVELDVNDREDGRRDREDDREDDRENHRENHREVTVKEEYMEKQVDHSKSTSNSGLIPPLTPPFTTLQRRQHIKKFLISNLGSITLSIASNPISEAPWIISDFRPNPHYNKKDVLTVITKTGSRKLGLTKAEEAKRRMFYQMAGDEVSDDDNSGNIDGFEDRLSQIFDKFPSPPGFMMSEFPNTQEDLRRRQVVARRQQRRIQRRLALCIMVQDGRQIGEFIFAVDILNEYVLVGDITLDEEK